MTRAYALSLFRKYEDCKREKECDEVCTACRNDYDVDEWDRAIEFAFNELIGYDDD